MSQTITIEATDIAGERGQYYRVHHNGAVLIERTWNPEYDAARILLSRGITGKVSVRRSDNGPPASTFDVERASELTISESAERGPQIAPWKPFSYASQTSLAGIPADTSHLPARE